MSNQTHPQMWTTVYDQLLAAGANSFVPWGDLEKMTGRGKDHSRSALTRARQQLECMDGMTISGQCAEGFWVRRQEDA